MCVYVGVYVVVFRVPVLWLMAGRPLELGRPLQKSVVACDRVCACFFNRQLGESKGTDHTERQKDYNNTAHLSPPSCTRSSNSSAPFLLASRSIKWELKEPGSTICNLLITHV